MYILSPNYSRFHFFFLPPAAGLTNRGPVRDSDPGAPLGLLRTYGLWDVIFRKPTWWIKFPMGFKGLWVIRGMG